MSHTPPIPAGNQSPYPLQEPPHAKTSEASSSREAPPADKKAAKSPATPQSVPIPTVIALAAGVGLAAIAGGLFYAFSGDGKPKKRRKRKAPKQA